MSPDEMVLDPWTFATDERERPLAGAPLARHAQPSPTQPSESPPSQPMPLDQPPVPPVRTIVLDRAPTPVRPVREREAVRSVSSTAGPERLSLRDVSIA